jgi:hypothetical protein
MYTANGVVRTREMTLILGRLLLQGVIARVGWAQLSVVVDLSPR